VGFLVQGARFQVSGFRQFNNAISGIIKIVI